MSIRLSNIRLGIAESESALPSELARALRVPLEDIRRWRILRKSLDARDKRDLRFVYTAEVAVAADEPALIERTAKYAPQLAPQQFAELPFAMPPAGETPLTERPVVIGSGPGGLAAAYFLAEQGYQPLVVERGRKVRERIYDVRQLDAGGEMNPESNYLFGEGGAGTFSDGKLTCRKSGPDVRRVLEMFAEHKGKPSILYDHRPHLGSNRLPAVVKALRRSIIAAGGEFRFDCRVEDIDVRDGQLQGVMTSSGYIPARVAILAIGHSARDTYQMLLERGLPMVPKPFQLGVRIEQPQDAINRVQYGPQPLETYLGAADYTVIAHGRRDLFSFCMCAGGQVIPSVSEPGYFCTNGMSLSRRDTAFANSGMMVTISPEEFGGSDPLAGMRLQQEFEARAYAAGRGTYAAPIQWARDFLAGRATTERPPASYPRDLLPMDLREVIPRQVTEALLEGLPQLDRRWRGKFLDAATLVGPESRGSAPVRMLRDPQNRESPGIAGIYPVGEGAGFAGGIVSAAVDGLLTAKAVVARYAPLVSR